jgi:hypothetical protein
MEFKMARTKKLTNSILRKLIAEERARLNETLEMGLKHPSEAPKRTREVQADKLANTLEDCVDYYKACKLKEAKLVEQLAYIQEAKRRLKKRLLRKL